MKKTNNYICIYIILVKYEIKKGKNTNNYIYNPGPGEI